MQASPLVSRATARDPSLPFYARSAYKGAALPHMLIDNKYAHFTF